LKLNNTKKNSQDKLENMSIWIIVKMKNIKSCVLQPKPGGKCMAFK
jgi:hypothetical protein